MIGTPTLSEVGVLAFVPDQWEAPWQPRHQVLVRLARYFHVVWVTPPPWWRDTLRSFSLRTKGAGPAVINQRPSIDSFRVYRPPKWFPEFGRPQSLARRAARLHVRRALAILENRGCQKTVVYIWRPGFADVVDVVPHDVSCYHIDDEYSFSTVEQPVDPVEARLIRRVDQVFIHSPALMKKKGHLNPNATFVPNGVDYHAFSTPQAEPDDLRSIPHPRIGYIGRIKEQLDLALIRTLATRHTNWSFVFVGPLELQRQDGVMRELQLLPNVHLRGLKPVQQLPAYVQHLDVCLLCYEVNGYTKFIYPLKLHEYLAAGRPVVGSPIESLTQFADLIRLARTPEEWSDALHECLSDRAHAPRELERRRQIARRYDWDRLVARIATTLAGRLGESYRNRLAETYDESLAYGEPSPTLL